jgi:hypothetical protein
LGIQLPKLLDVHHINLLIINLGSYRLFIDSFFSVDPIHLRLHPILNHKISLSLNI